MKYSFLTRSLYVLMILATTFSPGLVGAQVQQELRVVDSKGLTRAVSSVTSSAGVILHFSPTEIESMDKARFLLVQADGIAHSTEGEVKKKGEVHFAGVGAGTWRLRIEPRGLEPGRIEIVP